ARRATPDLLRRAAAPDLPPLRPGPETRGLTERAAERFGLPPEAVRAARSERAPRPPEALRTALPPPSPRPPVAAERNWPPRPDSDRDTRRQADDGP
ncbi:hypothetical protein ABTJ58_19425, partial [Acinetobacter baumannii]